MFHPTRAFNLGLIALVALNFVPHLDQHLLVGLVVALPSLIWRLLYEYQKVKLPHWSIKLMLILLSFGLVFNQYRTILGPEPASSLLLCGVSLKLIDRVSYRDAMVSLFLVFMLLMARFLEDQSLLITLIGGLDVLLVLTLLFQLHKGQGVEVKWKDLLKSTSKVLLQIAPLLILLFVVFPRFSVGFFKLRQQSRALTGFSNKMSPGDIAELATSDRVAFRVQWKNNQPATESLYWRGEVLEKAEGLRWSVLGRKQLQSLSAVTNQNSISAEVKYQVILEPHYGKWLFLLEHPVSLRFSNPKKQRQTYLDKLSSTYTIKDNNGQSQLFEASAILKSAPQLPLKTNRNLNIFDKPSKRLKTLVEKLKQNSSEEEVFVGQTLEYFAQNFKYTLRPGVVKTNTVDEFLFEKKKGFCEHFAASFAYIMRLGGVPARVVVGFHGGRRNELSDYLIVSDKDAHAWTEIWSKKENRWRRVDPTAVVAPARIELGGQIYHELTQESDASGLTAAQLNEKYTSDWLTKWVNSINFSIDLVSMRWRLFLLNYDLEKQKEIFKKIGFKDIKVPYLTLISVLFLVGFFIALRYFSAKRSKNLNQSEKHFRTLQKLMADKGIVKGLSEGPRDYFSRCKQSFDDEDQKAIRIFEKQYLSVIYGGGLVNKEELAWQKEFLKKLKTLKVKAHVEYSGNHINHG